MERELKECKGKQTDNQKNSYSSYRGQGQRSYNNNFGRFQRGRGNYNRGQSRGRGQYSGSNFS